MSKLKTDQIEPRIAGNVEIAGIDPPTHNGVPLADTGSPIFTGDPTFLGNPVFSGNPTAPTKSLADSSLSLANTEFASTRSAAEVNNRLSSSTPLTNNPTGAPGTSTDLSRADHVHPSDPTKLDAARHHSTFLFSAPGTTTNFFTAPVDGWIKAISVGAGGGGGGGGTDRAGGNGTAGIVNAIVTSIPAGTVFSVTVGTGGSGAAATTNPASPPSGSAGGNTTISWTPPGGSTVNLTGTGGAGGSVYTTGTLPTPKANYQYHFNDFGDYVTIEVAQGPTTANTPSSTNGNPALTGAPFGIPINGLAATPGLLNGGNGTHGAGGLGGAPTRAFSPARGGYIDPVHGEFGAATGIPTSTGGLGGNGLAYLAFMSGTTSPLTRGLNELGALDLLIAELKAQFPTLILTTWGPF